jgi:ribosomal-protein-alanine N-acetyltransferase
VLATAAERGCAEAFLEVRAGNAAAAALYSRFGFELVYQRPRYYPDGSDALVMHVGLPGSRRAP